MSDTAADLFADDLMRIIASRLQIDVLPSYGSDHQIVVALSDCKTGEVFSSVPIVISTARALIVTNSGSRRDVVTDVAIKKEW